MIDRVFIQHSKMKRVDWACINDDPRSVGLNTSVINNRLASWPLTRGATFYLWISPPRDPLTWHAWLCLLYEGRVWSVEKIGPIYSSLRPWEMLLDLRDKIAAKIPGFSLSWRAYHESNLWC